MHWAESANLMFKHRAGLRFRRRFGNELRNFKRLEDHKQNKMADCKRNRCSAVSIMLYLLFCYPLWTEGQPFSTFAPGTISSFPTPDAVQASLPTPVNSPEFAPSNAPAAATPSSGSPSPQTEGPSQTPRSVFAPESSTTPSSPLSPLPFVPSSAPSVSPGSSPSLPPSPITDTSPPAPPLSPSDTPIPSSAPPISREHAGAPAVDAPPSKSGGGLSGGQKAGVAIAVIFGVGLIATISFVLLKRKRNVRRARYGGGRQKQLF